MKKTYINPATKAEQMALGCHICIGSPNSSAPTDLEDVTDGGNDPGNFSRRHSIWDNEEGEEW